MRGRLELQHSVQSETRGRTLTDISLVKACQCQAFEQGRFAGVHYT